MAGERKAIRDAVKQVLEGIYAGDVFSSRYVDGRDLSEYVNVYFNEGQVDTETLVFATSAELVVGFHTKDYVSDDQLDEQADTLYQAIGDADIAPNVLRGINPAGFEYGDEQESAFTSIYLQFTVYY